MKSFWLAAATIVLILSGAVLLVAEPPAQEARQQEAQQEQAQEEEADDGRVQPVQFRHDIHVDTYQMECQYCHYSADRSVDAGIPSMDTCMGCHLQIGGSTPEQQAEIGLLREAWQAREPIEWVRIYKVSDHAHFPHFRHVNAGLACQQCHGQVQEMGPIEERDPAWGGDNMGWCISCHVEQEVTRDCTVCHY